MEEYPNPGDDVQEFESFPEEPQDQQDRADVEQSQIAASVPYIQKQLDWLQKSIDFYGNTDSMEIYPGMDPVTSVITMCTAKSMKGEFQKKLEEFKVDFAEYLKEDQPE